MSSLLTKILITVVSVLISISASATYVSDHSTWGFIKQEYENFYLIYDYRTSHNFGSPSVSGDGSTISFKPHDMSVEQRSGGHWRKKHTGWGRRSGERLWIDYDDDAKGAQTNWHFDGRSHYVGGSGSSAIDTWTTSIGIIPKDGFDASSFTLIEQGDYSYLPKGEGGEGTFSITARIFVRDMESPRDYQFLKLDESFTEDQEVRYEDWEVSQMFDIGDFTDGFWLTIQNTLEVEGSDSFVSVDGEQPTYSTWMKKWKKQWKHPAHRPWHANVDELFLQKKYIGIEFGGTEVPVPASAWLFVSAFALLAVVRRKAK